MSADTILDFISYRHISKYYSTHSEIDIKTILKISNSISRYPLSSKKDKENI